MINRQDIRAHLPYDKLWVIFPLDSNSVEPFQIYKELEDMKSISNIVDTLSASTTTSTETLIVTLELRLKVILNRYELVILNMKCWCTQLLPLASYPYIFAQQLSCHNQRVNVLPGFSCKCWLTVQISALSHQ